MTDLWASDEIKIATLCAVVVLFALLPFVQSRIAQSLPAQSAPLYLKFATNTFVRTVLLLSPALVAALYGYVRGALGQSITMSFLFILLFGGLGAAWSVRCARSDIREARMTCNTGNRAIRLDDVDKVSKLTAGAAAVSVALGLCGLVFVWRTEAQPIWFWALAFFLSIYGVIAHVWSLAVSMTASRYAGDPTLGTP